MKNQAYGKRGTNLQTGAPTKEILERQATMSATCHYILHASAKHQHTPVDTSRLKLLHRSEKIMKPCLQQSVVAFK